MFAWQDAMSTYIQNPPYFVGMTMAVAWPSATVHPGRSCLAKLA